MPLITYADKVDNSATSAATAGIPANEKISAADMNQVKTGINGNETNITAIKLKTDYITVSQAVDLNSFGTKLGFITITQAVNLDTIETDIAGVKTKTDYLTVTGATDLDAIRTKAGYLTVTGAINLDNVKTKTDYLTVTGAVNLDTINTNAGYLTVTANTNLDTLRSYNRTGVVTVTADATIASSTLVEVVNSATAVTVTLPASNTVPVGASITVKRLNTGNVIVARNGSDTIDGLSASYNFDTDGAFQYASRTLVSNGTNGWFII